MSITKKWKVTEIVDGKLIATASTLHVGAINAEANARAIAEVPAMIEALTHIAGLRKSADDTIGMVDFPHHKALSAASSIASAILKRIEG